jgi:CDP-4-dehydro-6-deoxyglucose reductase
MPDDTMSYQITVRPSGREFQADPGETLLAAGIRQGIGLPYGCKDGACGSCKCRKLEGIVVHGPHQEKALSPEEEAQGYVLTCCGVAESDVVLESRQVTSAGAFPILKMPARVYALERLGHDVMRVTLQLPSSNVLQYHAGQYIEFILRDGSHRSYSMANAPQFIMRVPAPGATPVPMVDLHIRHMPGGLFTDQVFGSMKERDILRI